MHWKLKENFGWNSPGWLSSLNPAFLLIWQQFSKPCCSRPTCPQLSMGCTCSLGYTLGIWETANAQHQLHWWQDRTHAKHLPDTWGSSEQIPLSSSKDESISGCPAIRHPHTHTISRAQGFARMQSALHSRASLRRFLQDLAVKGSRIKLRRKKRPK